MSDERGSAYLVECFWPGVRDGDLRALDERIATAVAETSRRDEPVRYLGSMLMRADEVVLCLFEGRETAVRTTAERAAIPFERILESARSPWPEDGAS